jgi:hypothetical protein
VFSFCCDVFADCQQLEKEKLKKKRKRKDTS